MNIINIHMTHDACYLGVTGMRQAISLLTFTILLNYSFNQFYTIKGNVLSKNYNGHIVQMKLLFMTCTDFMS